MKAFENRHPIALAVYFLSEILLCAFVWNPVLQLTALIGAILFCITLFSRKAVLSDLGFYIPLFCMIAVTNPLFSHNGVTPLFFLNGNPVTAEAFLYGFAIAVMLVAVLLWSKAYHEVFSSDKFLYLFGKITPKLALVLSMALRFVPLFRRQMQKVNRAQKAMGLYASKSYIERLRSALRVFSTMIAWSMENAMETAASMQARGFGLKGRTHFALYRFRLHDGVLLTASFCLVGITLVGVAAGQTTFRFYPRISAVQSSAFAVTVYIAYGLLSFLPFLAEVKENLQWTYYRSKI